MLKLVSDENFNADILRGLYRRRSDLDVVRVQDIGLNATPDRDILAWAAADGVLFYITNSAAYDPLIGAPDNACSLIWTSPATPSPSGRRGLL